MPEKTPKLQVETMEHRLPLSTAATAEPPPEVVVSAESPPAANGQSPDLPSFFGGDLLSPVSPPVPPPVGDGGDDTLGGGAGNDTIKGGTGNDII